MRAFFHRRRADLPACPPEPPPAYGGLDDYVHALIIHGRVLAESARIIVSGQVPTGRRATSRHITTLADPETAVNTLAHALDGWDMADAELTAMVNHIVDLRRQEQA